MSRENVEVVMGFVEAYVRGDIDEALSGRPDIEYKRAEEAMVRGRDAVRAGWEQWEADWEDLATIPEDPIDAGDHVVVPVLFRARQAIRLGQVRAGYEARRSVLFIRVIEARFLPMRALFATSGRALGRATGGASR
jgi:ketosteroid isomerase-like protein